MPIQSMILCESCSQNSDSASEKFTNFNASGITTVVRYYPKPLSMVLLVSVHPRTDSGEILSFRLTKPDDAESLCILDQLGTHIVEPGDKVFAFPHAIELEILSPGLFAIEGLVQAASDDTPVVGSRYWFHVVMD